MAFAASFAPAGSPDSLAPVRPGVLRSRVELNQAEITEAKLGRAKGRLYVLCQLGGWGVFYLLQLGFVTAFSQLGEQHGSGDRLSDNATLIMIILLGLLITHFARPYMTRRGWKELGWRAILPRVLGMAMVLSFWWTGLGYGYTHGLLRTEWPSKYSPLLILMLSWMNGVILMSGWLCLYFFYHTLDRLNRLRVEQLRLVASAREAELRALKSQVNPHFLFNSLNSLRALIDEDAPRARESVTRLANMLRYSLQSGQLETVPFEDELRIVEDYLALEQIRHESRLRVRWDIAEEVRSRSVPPMLLQTLAENAVKYGVSARRDGGEIGIAAWIDGGALHIRVSNPGELGSPASAAAARAGSSTGVGLRNASERLKLLFGDRATLRLQSEPAGCVSAEVFIPLLPPAR